MYSMKYEGTNGPNSEDDLMAASVKDILIVLLQSVWVIAFAKYFYIFENIFIFDWENAK